MFGLLWLLWIRAWIYVLTPVYTRSLSSSLAPPALLQVALRPQAPGGALEARAPPFPKPHRGPPQGNRQGNTIALQGSIQYLFITRNTFSISIYVFNIGHLIFYVKILLFATLVKYVGYLSNIQSFCLIFMCVVWCFGGLVLSVGFWYSLSGLCIVCRGFVKSFRASPRISHESRGSMTNEQPGPVALGIARHHSKAKHTGQTRGNRQGNIIAL